MPEVGRREQSEKKILTEMIYKNFPNLMKIITICAGSSMNLMQKKCERNPNTAPYGQNGLKMSEARLS